MKLIVSSVTLMKKLQSIGGIIGTNNILPIVENFKFEITEDNLRATATDTETTMCVNIPVQCKEKVTLCVEAKLLMDYLKNLSEQPLTFDINEKDYSVEITSDEGKYKMMGENAMGFPKEPSDEDANSFEMLSSRLLSGITNTVFAVGTDELRVAMTGVYFEMSPESITFVATDAHRLVRYMLANVKCGTTGGIIVPRKPLNQLKSLLANDDTLVKVSVSANNLFVSHDNLWLCCRLIDGKFPDYKVVIPNDNPYLLTINRADFLSALRRVNVFANKSTNQLVLKISASELKMFAQDVDFAHEGNESMPCTYNGEDLDIAFNGKLLSELVAALTVSEIGIELSTSSRAGILKPTEKTEGEDILMLIMPLMLNS
jgi:DNA polymerase III subunit beta